MTEQELIEIAANIEAENMEMESEDNKFSMDDPLHIPRIGEFVDSDKAGGWVDHVQYYYNLTPKTEFCLVVNVYLRKEK